MLADIIYPPVCPVCGKVIRVKSRIPYYYGKETYDSFICPACFKKLTFVSDHFCAVCGRELDVPGAGDVRGKETGIRSAAPLCQKCSEVPRVFAGGRSLLHYDGVTRSVMMALKYNSKKENADFIGYAVNDRLGEWIRGLAPDCIVPVPVSAERERERGYNQAGLIAGKISAYTGIPCADLLIRNKNTVASKKLGAKARVLNLRGAFAMKETDSCKGKRILLVDDICTTGVTLESCAEILLYEGRAAEVYVLSVCS